MSNIVLARLGENIKASTAGQVATSSGSTTAPALVDNTFSFRNKIINGDLSINQRGITSVSRDGGQSGNSAFYMADRFFFDLNINGTTGGRVTGTRSTDVPNSQFTTSARFQVDTAADSDAAVNRYMVIVHRIEGSNIADLISNTFTISFWVKSNRTGIYSCNLVNGDSTSNITHSYIAPFTINAANTWEYKTITVSGGLPSSITWDRTNGTGLQFQIVLDASLQYRNATTNSWVAGTFTLPTNNVKWMNTVGNNFLITGIQLERGSFATPFEQRPFGTELALCQRYFLRNSSGGQLAGIASTSSAAVVTNQLPVSMRITPAISYTGRTSSQAATIPGFGGEFIIAYGNNTVRYASYTTTPNVGSLGAFNATYGTLSFDAEL